MGCKSTVDNFFQEQKEKSAVKSEIVERFYAIYIRIISKSKIFSNAIKYYYIDLFSGPGIYDDGKESTPMRVFNVLNRLEDKDVIDKIQFVFNDNDIDYYNKLVSNLKNHCLYNSLKNEPIIYNKNADEIDLTPYLKYNNPVFSFIDPFGYKSTSVNQIWSLIKNIGSDCLFFFNVNRILMDFNKPNGENLKALFGSSYQYLNKIINSDKSSRKKDILILKMFCANIIAVSKESSKYKVYILPFEFSCDDKEKVSHYLLFISKNHTAIEDMKNVMQKTGNNSFGLGYDSKVNLQMCLFSKSNTMQEIAINVIKTFSDKICNKSFTTKQLYITIEDLCMENYYKVPPYNISDFKYVLKSLYDDGKVKEKLSFRKREVFADSKQFTLINLGE